MRIAVLGAAAGGGFPQWNCACTNCRRLRQGKLRGKARSQAQLAISSDSESWFLLNASPDLRTQIESTPYLWPQQPANDGSTRHTPIRGVILTSGDLDQALGLLLLREFQPLHVYSTESIRRILVEDNSIFGVLRRFQGQVCWHDVRVGSNFSFGPRDKSGNTMKCRTLELAGNFPDYVSQERGSQLSKKEAVTGLALESADKRMTYLPALPQIDQRLLAELDSADLIFVDGTFWSDDELRQTRGEGPLAREIGHVPISGPDGSLAVLANLRHQRKVYIHVNNTNPILDEDSAEYRQVRDAGWEVAHDGQEFEL
jgi:pyrroloquinoline quinone biosynthesis protein B